MYNGLANCGHLVQMVLMLRAAHRSCCLAWYTKVLSSTSREVWLSHQCDRVTTQRNPISAIYPQQLYRYFCLEPSGYFL